LKKALVIGGSGFAGRQLVSELLSTDHEVFAMEHRSPIARGSNVTVIRGGTGAIGKKLLRSINPDFIFHFARPTFPVLRRPGRVIAASYAAWLNRRLIRAIEHSGLGSKLIFASGSLMYGSSPSPVYEDAPLNPASYARQYYRGEIPILEALKAGNVPVIVLRMPWLLGKGSWFEWFYLRTMEKHRMVPLFGDGANLMEVLDIRDAARMAVKYAIDPETRGIFNLVTPKPVTQMEFAGKVSDLSGFPVRDYREAFQGKLEKEALQAFTSNIVLATKYPDLIAGFHYTSLEESLKRLLENK
jgi:nucleoside-diphosphate-sugar epimerase